MRIRQCHTHWPWEHGRVAGPAQPGITSTRNAASWYRKAADRGNASAQTELGVMYAKGQGVTQDHVQDHKWFNLAAVSGSVAAVENRDIAAGRMTPAQIAEAQRLASAWRAK